MNGTYNRQSQRYGCKCYISLKKNNNGYYEHLKKHQHLFYTIMTKSNYIFHISITTVNNLTETAAHQKVLLPLIPSTV